MKVILFCGGLGTRIREYSESVPKPMVPVGQHPIIWHVMQYYMHYGHREFVLCLGHKANVIKDYFLNYRPTTDRDFVISERGSKIEILGDNPDDWKVSLIDTGIWRNIGQRLVAAKPFVTSDDVFLANYSDGLTDAPLDKMIEFFQDQKKIELLSRRSAERELSSGRFQRRRHRQALSHEPTIRDLDQRRFLYVSPRNIRLHARRRGARVEPFQRLIEANELVAYKHNGFWASMDTLKDKKDLEDMMERGQTPWLPWLQDHNGQCSR